MTITRISVDSAGNQANGFSNAYSISANGRFVAFQSQASNLVPGDTNNKNDIFVRDLSTNTTTRVSVDSAGIQGNNDSFSPSISADGRFVAFASFSNLVPEDTNNTSDIFVRDLLTNTTTRVSVDSAGNQGNTAFQQFRHLSRRAVCGVSILCLQPSAGRHEQSVRHLRAGLVNQYHHPRLCRLSRQSGEQRLPHPLHLSQRAVCGVYFLCLQPIGRDEQSRRHLRAGLVNQYHHPRLCRLSRQSGEQRLPFSSISADGRFVAF